MFKAPATAEKAPLTILEREQQHTYPPVNTVIGSNVFLGIAHPQTPQS